VYNQDWVPFNGTSAAVAAPEATTGRTKVTPALVPDVVRQGVRYAAEKW
jgi:hypothetical protein